MTLARRAPYGTWKSPISAQKVAASDATIEDILVDKLTSTVYLVEKRPTEGGRNAIVSAADGQAIFGEGWNARSAVHEYGGASAIAHGGSIYFSDIKDDRVYKCKEGEEPIPITPENPHHRFADFTIHPIHNEFLVCICEDHTKSTPSEVVTTLVVIDAKKQTVSTLVKGADFYDSPRFNSEGRLLVWKQWHHPDMPWEGSEIFVAQFNFPSDEGAPTLGEQLYVAGERRNVSATEPAWVANDSFLFISDKEGYFNPWRFTCDPSNLARSPPAVPVSSTPISEDFSEAAWELGLSSFAVLDQHRAIFSAFRQGRSLLYLTDLDHGVFTELQTPYVFNQFMHSVGSDTVVFVGKKLDDDPKVIELTVTGNGAHLRLQVKERKPGLLSGTGGGPMFPTSYISPPRPIELKVLPDGYSIHVNFYAPVNPDYDGGQPGERPPVIVDVHGGPTWMHYQALDWQKQYFTSRGWAWIDLNYRGSSGYGRAYRDQLNGKWGIVDVQDAAESIVQLDTLGLIDHKRAFIRGGSAGGFTALAVVSNKETAEVFAGAAPSYGVSDLAKLHLIIHKFESHYFETLVGGKIDEIPDVWKERSPVTNVGNIKKPLLILQGAEDTVIPPVQMEEMVEIIRKNGGQVKYVVFEGEGHGWRKAETIQASLEQELAFYGNVLGLGQGQSQRDANDSM